MTTPVTTPVTTMAYNADHNDSTVHQWHMTPEGPRPCSARDKSRCPYRDRVHGTESELATRYEDDLNVANDLKTRLIDAARAYYQDLDADSSMTDEEYDAGIAYLRRLNSEYDLDDGDIIALLDGKVAGGTSVDAKNASKVHHDVPMLSLRKADSEEQVREYLADMETDGATGFKLQAKLDGIACSAQYEDGALTTMSTRGNGAEGEDMSYLIHNPDVTVKGLPEHLSGKLSDATVEIRGELFLRPSEFRKMNETRADNGGEQYKNPRNTNAGIVKRAAKGMNGEKATLQFVMYKIVGSASADDLADAGVAEISRVTEDEWRKTGMPMPSSLSIMMDGDTDAVTASTMQVIGLFDPVRAELDVPTDGIVIKPVNEMEMDEKLGSSSHSPRSQLAFKYPGARTQVKITGVEWTVGKSGKLTPTVTYEPTEFGGTMNSRATLHNAVILEELGISVGSVIEVEKRHEILPEVIREQPVFSNKTEPVIHAPRECPYCGTEITRGQRIYSCPNTKCSSRGSYVLKAAAGKGSLNLDGMGGSLVEALQDSGRVSTIADFYDLNEDTLANTPVGTNDDGGERLFGHTRARHVMDFIEESRKLPFHRVLSSLSIPDLGPQTARAIIKKYPTIDEIHAASIDDLSEIPGIGQETARKVKNGISDQWPTIERLRKAGLQMDERLTAPAKPLGGEDNDSSVVTRALKGKRFSISGSVPEGYANRGEWQEFVNAMGGEAQGSPNKDTDYMIGDPSSNSGKIAKARKLGVKIISPEEFAAGIKRGGF